MRLICWTSSRGCPGEITTKDFVDVDDEVLTIESFTEEEVLADFSELQVEQDDSDNDNDYNVVNDEPVKYFKSNELLDAIELLQRFSSFSNEGSAVQVIAIYCIVKLISI